VALWLAFGPPHDAPQTVALTAIAAVLGHLFPVFLRFKGGKGVSTVLGVFLYASPIPILIATGSFVCVVVLFRYVSLGSLVAAVVFPAAYLLLTYQGTLSSWLLFAVVVCPGLVIVKHHENIQRLWAGTERKLGG
jgi:glycerol-3-phosphate acyltransferase PlsY